MKDDIFDLMHFRDLAPGDAPNVDRHGGKCIGVYSSEARALEGMRRVVDKPGFRDWPDGFRLSVTMPDTDHWLEGFVTETD